MGLNVRGMTVMTLIFAIISRSRREGIKDEGSSDGLTYLSYIPPSDLRLFAAVIGRLFGGEYSMGARGASGALFVFMSWLIGCQSIVMSLLPLALSSGEVFRASLEHLVSATLNMAIDVPVLSSISIDPDLSTSIVAPGVDSVLISTTEDAMNTLTGGLNDKYPLLPYLNKLGEIQSDTIRFFTDSPEIGEALTAKSYGFWGGVPGRIQSWTDGILDSNPALKLPTSELVSQLFQQKADRLAFVSSVMSESPLLQGFKKFKDQPFSESLASFETAFMNPSNPINQAISKIVQPLENAANNFVGGIDRSFHAQVSSSYEYLNAPPTPYELELTAQTAAALDTISKVSEAPEIVTSAITAKISQVSESSSQISEAVTANAAPALNR